MNAVLRATRPWSILTLLPTIHLLLLGSASGSTLEVLPDESLIQVHTGKSGFISWTGAGHEHEVRATRFSGSVCADPAAPESTTVVLTIAAGSLEVVDDLDADTVQKIQRRMETELLDIDEYGFITFRSTSVVVDERHGDVRFSLTLSGLLEIRGKVREITFPLELEILGSRARATGEATMRQTDFGIDPVSVGFGAVKVKDELRVGFDITAAGRDPAPESK